ncbi:MAG: redoxin domain-containing protein [Myxococcales bacterium]|nr:redoxin domain-containing protein [Myxococcales bacterium]
MLVTDTLPKIAGKAAEVVAVHCDSEGGTSAFHVQSFGLTYPMLLDFDSELFRRFRLPDHVFPLDVVIDKQGKVAYVGTVLDDAVKALLVEADK